MIFVLDTTPNQLHDYIKNHGKEARANIEDLFSRLADCSRSLKHFVILSNRGLVKWALKNLQLSGNSKKHLENQLNKFVKNQATDSRALIEQAKKYLKIVIGNDGIKKESEKEFSIGHKKFLDGEYANVTTSFVVESIESDGKVYEHIFNEIRMVLRLPAINFNFVDGNGSKTARVFENQIKQSVVVACIVDSDNKGVPKKYGSTAMSFVKIFKDKLSTFPSFIGDVVCTTGHEVENYVPYSIGKGLLGEENLEKLNSKISPKETDAEKERLWLALDIKDNFKNINIIEKFFNDKNKVSINEFHSFVRKDSEWRKIFLGTFEDFIWFFAAPAKPRI